MFRVLALFAAALGDDQRARLADLAGDGFVAHTRDERLGARCSSVALGWFKLRLLDLAGPQPALLLFDDGRLPGWDLNRIKQQFLNINDLKLILIVSPKAPNTEGGYIASDPLWRIWNPSWGLAALIRPDGHVGWMERRPTLAQLDKGVRKALGSCDSGG